ncbi:MAG: MerR family transcriptional regulator [Firmicutes bacterium]|nr:MerR family transcriptional regulator [Bacillota bacterium]
MSQVAKMFNITRTSLIHYDKWGILSPSIRNEKKYRLYTQEDINRLELILALKESGLSLKEIKSYLSGNNDTSSIELLELQKKEIDKKIKDLKTQRLIIEKRISDLTLFKKLELYEGILENEYPQTNSIKEHVGYGHLMDYDSAVQRLKNKLGRDGQLSSKFGICFDIKHSDPSGKYKMKYVFDYLHGDIKDRNEDNRPINKFIRCLHKGQYTSVEITINKLLAYAKEKNYKVLGEAYYVPLFDYWESMTDEFIGEVLIQIEKESQ